MGVKVDCMVRVLGGECGLRCFSGPLSFGVLQGAR